MFQRSKTTIKYWAIDGNLVYLLVLETRASRFESEVAHHQKLYLLYNRYFYVGIIVTKQEYLLQLSELKKLLSKRELKTGVFAVGDIAVVFDRDSEGFYEENTITVSDFFSKIEIELNYHNREWNGVSVTPFMNINGCQSLVPRILGKIDLYSTFNNLKSYIKSHFFLIFSYNTKTEKYSATIAGKKYCLNVDPMNYKSVEKLKTIAKNNSFKIEFDNDFEGFFNDNEINLKLGTNVYEYLGTSKHIFDLNPENFILYPELVIKYDDYKHLNDICHLVNR